MNTIRVIIAISWMNIRTIRNRLGASIVIVVGIGGYLGHASGYE